MAFQSSAFQGGAFQLEGSAYYYHHLTGESVQLFRLNEPVAARRRMEMLLVDVLDGLTPETGETGGQPQISKNGGTWTNTTGVLVDIGNGSYYVELTAAELDTEGHIRGRYKSANTAEWSLSFPVRDLSGEVWDTEAADHDTTGTMGANLQSLADAVLIWPVPVGGGTAASDLIERAMAIADVHDNFVSETEWLRWLNQEQYALRLFLARSGWALPFDTTIATITSAGWSLVTDGASAEVIATNAAGHYIFTPTLADVMAVVAIHESQSSGLRRLDYNDNVSFQKQLPGSALATGHAQAYRLRMYGNELHADFYPTPVAGETYLITYLSAPVPLTATDQAVALPMGWEERLVLGMARRALIKEESDPGQIERLIGDMDSQIEQLCWNRVMSESPHIRNSDRNTVLDMPSWQSWYWR